MMETEDPGQSRFVVSAGGGNQDATGPCQSVFSAPGIAAVVGMRSVGKLL